MASCVIRGDGLTCTLVYIYSICIHICIRYDQRRRPHITWQVGIIGGAVVGLLGRSLVLPPETAPLGWLYLGVTKLGNAAVPINLILLGAALSRTPEAGQLPSLTAAGITVARLILMPLCGLGVAKGLMHFVQVYMHAHAHT